MEKKTWVHIVEKCGTELIDNVCPKCSQKKELNGIEGNNGKKQVIQTQQSRTVDLKDITGTGFDKKWFASQEIELFRKEKYSIIYSLTHNKNLIKVCQTLNQNIR